MLILKKLAIHRFKGLNNITIELSSDQTSFAGANGTGKTTLVDAFTWLLFGKDSNGRTDFEIKTINPDGSITPQLEYTVEAELENDGSQISLRKTYKEKWVKKKGAAEAEMSGHETVCYWNEAPVTLTEYNKRIRDIVDEEVFRLITSPTEFPSRHWKQQRDTLFSIANVDDTEILDREEFAGLKDIIKDRPVDDVRAELASKISKVKKELALVPARIDEVHSGMPEERDWSLIEEQRDRLEKEIADIEDQIEDKSQAFKAHQDKKEEYLKAVREKKARMADIKYELEQAQVQAERKHNQAMEKLEAQLQEKEEAVKKITSTLRLLQENKTLSEAGLITLREEWKEVNSRELELNTENFVCPTCKRPYDTEDLETVVKKITENFNKQKADELEAIKKKADAIKAGVGETQASIQIQFEKHNSLTKDLEAIKAQIAELAEQEPEVNKPLMFTEEYMKLEKEVADLETKAKKEYKAPETAELKEQKEKKIQVLKMVNEQLTMRSVRAKDEARIKELKQMMKDYAQQQADYEKQLMEVDNMIRAKVEYTEERINKLFEFVKFKLFDEQINGAIVETCVATIDGVPYPALNSAGKVKAGIDIINTISSYYNASAPIFIDNRESVTVIPDTNSQVINLFVDPNYTTITKIQ